MTFQVLPLEELQQMNDEERNNYLYDYVSNVSSTERLNGCGEGDQVVILYDDEIHLVGKTATLLEIDTPSDDEVYPAFVRLEGGEEIWVTAVERHQSMIVELV